MSPLPPRRRPPGAQAELDQIDAERAELAEKFERIGERALATEERRAELKGSG